MLYLQTDSSGTGVNLSLVLQGACTSSSGELLALAQALEKRSVILPLIIDAGEINANYSLNGEIDLTTLIARLEAGESCEIRGKRERGTLFGMTYEIRPRAGAVLDVGGTFAKFVLEFSSGAPRIALHKDTEADLYYTRLGAGGRGLVFKISEFLVGQGQFDIVADVDPKVPVDLRGVNMPFRFDVGRLVIKRGEIQAFSITGSGQLPPELVGQANCKVILGLGRDSANGLLAVLTCDAQLDKTKCPIACFSTRFELTISKLGLALVDMERKGGYQFYFQVTGTLVFAPVKDEFSNTFLKNLRGLKINLNKVPLARDIIQLSQTIDFHIPIVPKMTFNLFDSFAFELRGIGYLGACDAFDGDPALVISGQVKMTPSSDTISARIDLHNMYISNQLPGTRLPRVRFDGLGVALALQTGSIDATAIAVDGNLPTLYRPDIIPRDTKMRGFFASGRVNLRDWVLMNAAMSFLELTEPDGHKRHALFVYGQLENLSTKTPSPVKPIYLRETGFGIGYRYTMAGLHRANTVSTIQALVEVLDDVSHYQDDTAHPEAWKPEIINDHLTLALQPMLSPPPQGPVGEAQLTPPNLLLIDVAAALRSDLTSLMSARGWLCVNYADWSNGIDSEPIGIFIALP